MQEQYGADKTPNDFIEALVKQHEEDILRHIQFFREHVPEDKSEEFFSIDTKGKNTLLPLKQSPTLPTRGSQREMFNQGKSGRTIQCPDSLGKIVTKEGHNKSKSATDDTNESRSGSRVLDPNIVKSRRASGFAPGPKKMPLIPRSDRSIKDVATDADRKSMVCKSMKEIESKNILKSNEEAKEGLKVNETIAKSGLSPLTPIKIVAYRTQIELGLNYLIKLEIDAKPYLAVIGQKKNDQVTEVRRVAKL